MLETRFLENLNQKQLLEEAKASISPVIANTLLSKDIHLKELEVSPSYPEIGKTLRELDIRNQIGVNIVTIIRGNVKINIPEANERLYPFDKVVVAGSDDDIQRATQAIEYRYESENEEEELQYHINLSQYVVDGASPLVGHSIKKLGIQERTECMIINIERDGSSIVTIPPSLILQEGDILLIAGERDKLNLFEANILSAMEKDVEPDL